MSNAEALLRQILAKADDDQLRLVYADVLQADGNPRGELIAIDLELGRTGLSERRTELSARRTALLEAHGGVWWPELPVARLDIRRGFVERVAGTAAELAAAQRIFDSEPVARAELCGAGSTFEEAPWQRRITELAVRGYLDKQGLVALAASPIAEQLERLDLASISLWQVPQLAADAFPGLRWLSLADNRLADRAGPFTELRCRTQIEVLDLRRCQLAAPAVMELIAGMTALRELRLSGNPIGPDGGVALARRLGELPALRTIELLGTGTDEATAQAIAKAVPLAAVTVGSVPERVALDLVGTTLVFVHEDGAKWRIEQDGVARHIEVAHSVRYDGGQPPTVTHGGSGKVVELGALAKALAQGAARKLVGKRAEIELASSIGAIYNTSVWSSETVSIALTPNAVEITFSEYIDTSS